MFLNLTSLNVSKLEPLLKQAALDKSKTFENDDISAEDSNNVPEPEPEPEELVASQMNALSISQNPSMVSSPKSTESSTPVNDVQDIDKKIRALKKKVKFEMLF